MKIAMVGHKRIPSREGGIEVVVEELATRLTEQGHEVVAFNRSGKHINGDKSEKASSYKNIKIKTVPTLNIKGIEVILYSFFATILVLFGKFDVVHYHAEGPASMCWLTKLFRIKTVVTIHGLDWQRSKWGNFASSYIKFGEKVAVKFADDIIVLSDNLKNYFWKEYSRETIFIPNGIDVKEKLECDIIKKHNLSSDDYILFLARIVPEKGLHYLINAFKEIKTDKKLVIAGGSSQAMEYFYDINELVRGDDRIVMTGFIKGQELEEIFSNAYLYVLPSDIEGMPISLLEAMSYSCACLVSDIPESAEVIKDAGFTFKKSNVSDLKLKLEYLLSNPQEVKKSGKMCNDIVSKNYKWDSVVEQTLKVYQNKKV